VLSGCVRGYRGRCPQRKRKSRRKRRVQQLLAAAGGRARGRWLAEAQRWLSTDHAELAPTAVAGAGAGGGGGASPLARAAKEKRAQGACVLLSFSAQFVSAPNPARPRAGGRSGGFVEPGGRIDRLGVAKPIVASRGLRFYTRPPLDPQHYPAPRWKWVLQPHP
jgi:hypothetical protein